MRCRIGNFKDFLVQLGIFGIIAGALLVLNVAQRWFTEMLKLKLRQGLVHDLVQNWLMPGPRLPAGNAGPIGVNPDQRMHEDARHLTELSADLRDGAAAGLDPADHLHQRAVDLSSGFVFHLRARISRSPATWCGRRSSTPAPRRW
jgi:putative ATP-binding cassette transporter